MNAAIVLAGVGLLLTIWWWRSAKRRVEQNLRQYFKELAEWEIKRQKK